MYTISNYIYKGITVHWEVKPQCSVRQNNVIAEQEASRVSYSATGS